MCDDNRGSRRLSFGRDPVTVSLLIALDGSLMLQPAIRAVMAGTAYIVYGLAVAFGLLIIDQILKAHANFGSGSLGSDPIKYGLLMVSGVLGILSKAIYDVLEMPRHSPTPESLPRLLARALGFRNVARALLISPLVILALFRAIADIDSYPLVCLLGYQNGFFFQSLKGRSVETGG